MSLRNIHAVDFFTPSAAGDSNAQGAAAIRPVSNGEGANQDSFRRPSENLRTRTETLRELARELAFSSDLDRGLRLYSTATFTFTASTGVLEWNGPVYFMTLQGPGDPTLGSFPYVGSTKAALTVPAVDTTSLVFTSVYKQFDGTTAPAHDFKYADAANTAIEIQNTGDTVPVITVTADAGGEHRILVGINFGTTTCSAVVSAVNGDVEASKYVVCALGGGAVGSDRAPTWSLTEWAGDYSLRFLRGGFPDVLHTINGPSSVTLDKGDACAVHYDKNIDLSGVTGRYQSTIENDPDVTGDLFVTRTTSTNLPGCIPFCRRIDTDRVLLFDGSVIIDGHPAKLGADSLMLTGAENGESTASWSFLTHQSAPTLHKDLETIDAALDKYLTPFQVVGPAADAGDLAAAITACDAAGGGLILVYPRSGGYTVTSEIVLTTAVHIVGLGQLPEDVEVQLSGTGRVVPASGCSFKNIKMFAATATVVSLSSLKNVKIEDCIFDGLNLDVVSADNHTFKNLAISRNRQDVYSVFRFLGENCTLENVTITPTTGLGLEIRTGSQNITINNLSIDASTTAASALQILRVEGSDLYFSNLSVKARYTSLDTSAVPALAYLVGEKIYIDGFKITTTDAVGAEVGALLYSQLVDSRVNNLVLVTPKEVRDIAGTSNRNQVILTGVNTEVNGFIWKDILWPYGANALNIARPVIVTDGGPVNTLDGLMTIKNANFSIKHDVADPGAVAITGTFFNVGKKTELDGIFFSSLKKLGNSTDSVCFSVSGSDSSISSLQAGIDTGGFGAQAIGEWQYFIYITDVSAVWLEDLLINGSEEGLLGTESSVHIFGHCDRILLNSCYLKGAHHSVTADTSVADHATNLQIINCSCVGSISVFGQDGAYIGGTSCDVLRLEESNVIKSDNCRCNILHVSSCVDFSVSTAYAQSTGTIQNCTGGYVVGNRVNSWSYSGNTGLHAVANHPDDPA